MAVETIKGEARVSSANEHGTNSKQTANLRFVAKRPFLLLGEIFGKKPFSRNPGVDRAGGR
jgi:hypothetical protein